MVKKDVSEIKKREYMKKYAKEYYFHHIQKNKKKEDYLEFDDPELWDKIYTEVLQYWDYIPID